MDSPKCTEYALPIIPFGMYNRSLYLTHRDKKEMKRTVQQWVNVWERECEQEWVKFYKTVAPGQIDRFYYLGNSTTINGSLR